MKYPQLSLPVCLFIGSLFFMIYIIFVTVSNSRHKLNGFLNVTDDLFLIFIEKRLRSWNHFNHFATLFYESSICPSLRSYGCLRVALSKRIILDMHRY